LVATVDTPGSKNGEPGGAEGAQHQQAAAFLDRVLDQFAQTRDWADLTAVLRRVRAGNRDRAALARGLDEIDTAILARTLAALDGSDPIDPALWATADNDDTAAEDDDGEAQKFLAAVVAAAQGNEQAAEIVDPILDRMSEHSEGVALASALRAILDGDRSPTLTSGLDPDVRPLVDAVLSALAD
jgi:hypothetical protein